MKAFKADIYFMDQAPRIGCGWRRCMVRVGRRWVRIEECASGRRAKLLRFTLDGRTKTRFDTLERMGARPVL